MWQSHPSLDLMPTDTPYILDVWKMNREEKVQGFYARCWMEFISFQVAFIFILYILCISLTQNLVHTGGSWVTFRSLRVMEAQWLYWSPTHIITSVGSNIIFVNFTARTLCWCWSTVHTFGWNDFICREEWWHGTTLTTFSDWFGWQYRNRSWMHVFA